MKQAKAAGTARENQLKKQLEGEGWVVVRSPASGSPVDLWAMKQAKLKYALVEFGRWGQACEIKAIQLKANTGSPWMNFRKAERQELLEIAERAGATPWLVHWPPRRAATWYTPSEWPKNP